MVMKDLKEEVVDADRRMVGSLDMKKVARGFSFYVLPLTNPVVIDDFKQEHKTKTYITVHLHAFDFDPTDNEIMWLLES